MAARMKVFSVIALLSTASSAFACDLSLVAPARSGLKDPVQATAVLENETLNVRFVVSAPTLNAKPALGPNEYPYQFDVVELFVSFSDSGFPYFEFEVSPYNQTF